MTLTAPQLELDFQLGHTRPWLRVSEVAAALEVTEDHVYNLFDDASIDFVIDIKPKGGVRPYYRILREAWENFQARRRFGHSDIIPHPSYELVLNCHLSRLPMAMGTETVASFLSVSENHVLSLANHFTDLGTASQRFFRASKSQLTTFITARRLA